MGLDITVHRLKKATKKNIENYEFFRLVSNNGIEDLSEFPHWCHELVTKITEDWFDWDKLKKEKGIDIHEWDWVGECYGDEGNIMSLKHVETKKTMKLDMDKIPTFKQEISIIGYDEVGYQRKGLNSKFYEDYNNHKIGYFVWNKNELERYMRDYCDDDEDKERFKRNIIDEFIDGECCVTFDW